MVINSSLTRDFTVWPVKPLASHHAWVSSSMDENLKESERRARRTDCFATRRDKTHTRQLAEVRHRTVNYTQINLVVLSYTTPTRSFTWRRNRDNPALSWEITSESLPANWRTTITSKNSCRGVLRIMGTKPRSAKSNAKFAVSVSTVRARAN